MAFPLSWVTHARFEAMDGESFPVRSPVRQTREGRFDPFFGLGRRGGLRRSGMLLGLLIAVSAFGEVSAEAPKPSFDPPPRALPDLLPKAGVRPGPGRVPVVALSLLAVLPAALAWVGLAAHRAWRQDPLRDRRRAHRELVRLLDQVQRRSPTRVDLESWRALCVRRWGLPQAVPNAGEIAAHIGSSAAAPGWIALWLDTEESLYSSRPEPRSDWAARARALVPDLPAFPSAPWWPARVIHWWPLSAAASVGLMLGVARVHGADARVSYQQGQFAEAAKLWLQEIVAQPGDWSARHNAALAMAQSDQWGLAAGQWTSAFLFNPRDPSVLAGLQLALSRIETADPALARIVENSGWGKFAVWFPVAEWQGLVGTGSLALSLGLLALVIALYRPGGKGRYVAGLALATAGGMTILTSLLAINRYGPTADSQAAFITRSTELRSIPSDLVGKQQTATLFAGTIVKVHRSFLGWDQVSLGGDIAGWVRTDALVWLYRSRNDAKAANILQP